MNFQPAFIFKIRQVLLITVVWILAGILVELNNAIAYDPTSRSYSFYFVFGDSAVEHLLITAMGPLFGGLLAGSFIVFYQREKVRGKTYTQKLLIHTSLYLFYLVIVIMGVGILGAQNNPANAPFWVKFREDVFSLRALRLVFDWFIIVVLTVFFP